MNNLIGLICVSKVREVFQNKGGSVEVELEKAWSLGRRAGGMAVLALCFLVTFEVEVEITLIQATLAIVDKSRQVFWIIRNIEAAEVV